jgi:Domain of unknown function (DUF6985)
MGRVIRMARKAAKLGPPPEVGEVLAVPLADGQFGACRVLGVRREGRGTPEQVSYVVATRYVGPEPPGLKDRALRRTLVLICDDDDEPFAFWVWGLPPAAYVSVGVITPKPEEKPPRNHDKRRTGWEEYAYYTLRQWQWDNDREAFLAAEAAEKARHAGKDPDAPRITDPVFGRLVWVDGGWKGTVKLTRFAPTAQVMLYAEDEEPPSDAHRRAFASFIETEDALYGAAEAHNWEHYNSVVLEDWRPNALEWAQDDPDQSESDVYKAMPDLESPAQVWKLLSDLTLHIPAEQDEGWSLDLEWKCTWDEIGEHNYWIAIRNGEVGDSAFGY